MIARIVTLMTIVTLALPNATLAYPEESGHGPWSASTVVAKGKPHKKKKIKSIRLE
jgi:hypothetical protein